MFPKIITLTLVFCIAFMSCTKLDEKFGGQLTSSQVGSGGSSNVGALLNGVYNSMRGTFQGQAGVYALWEMTTDELIGPTRGGDWDDNGAWRVLHTHHFDADHLRIREVFSALGSAIYSATDLL